MKRRHANCWRIGAGKSGGQCLLGTPLPGWRNFRAIGKLNIMTMPSRPDSGAVAYQGYEVRPAPDKLCAWLVCLPGQPIITRGRPLGSLDDAKRVIDRIVDGVPR
jgi:hypothetical protein